MATANSIFWAAQGWDGSENMALSAAPYCTRRPEHARVAVMSYQTIKTVVITLQGAQALYQLFGNAFHSSLPSLMSLSVDGIFLPLAVVGLLRLVAALWLTDDLAFTEHDGVQLAIHTCPQTGGSVPAFGTGRLSMDSLIEQVHASKCEVSAAAAQFREVSCRESRIFRAAFYFPLLLIWGMCLFGFSLAFVIHKSPTMTAVLILLLYLQLFTGTVIVLGYYLMRGRTTTTIIPCAAAAWYKIYTLWIMAWAVLLLVVACIETRNTPCGRYTTIPGDEGDHTACT
jgi:hypothetical protein